MGVFFEEAKHKNSRPVVIVTTLLLCITAVLFFMMIYTKDAIYLTLNIGISGLHFLFDGLLDYKRTESKKEALLSIVVGIIGIGTSLLFYLLPS